MRHHRYAYRLYRWPRLVLALILATAAATAIAAGSRSVQLVWEAPLLRADGQPIEAYEIEGYRIRYGRSPGSHEHEIMVPGAHQTSYVVEQLDPAETYYFVVTTVDTQGSESLPSETAVLEPLTAG